MPPARKPAERRQGRHATDLGVVTALPLKSPVAPARLLKSTRSQWESFWVSPMASAVNVASDRPALDRLFTLYDERERAYRGYRKQRVVVGSMGQPVLNPLGKLLQTYDAEIRQLEDRFGMSPKARLNLGATVASTARSLDDLNRRLEHDDEDDPRVIVVDAKESRS